VFVEVWIIGTIVVVPKLPSAVRRSPYSFEPPEPAHADAPVNPVFPKAARSTSVVKFAAGAETMNCTVLRFIGGPYNGGISPSPVGFVDELQAL
jgi:hypothetical protein